jgi:hypothetical protein
MTREWNDKDRPPTPFSLWIRNLRYPLNSGNYDAQNLDYIWFHYRQGWFITIEEKRFGHQSRNAQSDTHSIVSQLLTLASGQSVMTMRGKRPIVYRGHYIVSFEQTTPDDSAWVRINQTLYCDPPRATIELLTYGALPPIREDETEWPTSTMSS